jgi:hypothetical protein
MSRRKNYRLRAAATARAAKARKKKAPPNVSNNLDVEPEVTEYTSSQAMQEASQANQPRTPDGEECIAVSDGAVSNLLLDSDDECGWDGTVNHVPTSESDSDSDFEPGSSTDTESESDLDIEVLDLEGEELLKSLGLRLEKELELLTMLTSYEKIQDGAAQRWAKAETNRNLGYNGLSARTRCRQEQKARSKDKSDAVSRNR